MAPKYKKGNKKPIDIWIKHIRSEPQQLPPVGSDDEKVLKQLISIPTILKR